MRIATNTVKYAARMPEMSLVVLLADSAVSASQQILFFVFIEYMTNSSILNFITLPCKPLFIAVGGSSGIGKSTLIQTLLNIFPHRYARPLSYTSRQQRIVEDNSEYIFITEKEILNRHSENELLNLDYVYGNYYGISKSSLGTLLLNNKYVIKEIHPSNHEKLRQSLPDMLSILLLPDNDNYSLQRIERNKRDEGFYKDIDASKFDIVYRLSINDSPEDIAYTIDTAILAISKTDHYFPRPPVIDAVNREGYTAVAKEFQDDKRITTAFFHKLSYSFFSNAISSYVKPKSLCLEVGPGTGWLYKTFTWPEATYFAVDICSEMLKMIKEHCPNTRTEEASAKTLPWLSNTFDTIFASLCDPYCYPAALCEFSRVLKPNGHLVISAPAKMWSEGIREKDEKSMTAFLLTNHLQKKVYSFTFHLTELLSLLQLCDLHPVEYCVKKASQCKDVAIPPAITASCKRLQIKEEYLETVNCVVAVKQERNTENPY